MKTLLVFARHGVTHLVISDGDKRHLNGCDLGELGIINEPTPHHSELMSLVFDSEGNIATNGYNISALTPMTIEFLEAHDVSYIIFVRG